MKTYYIALFLLKYSDYLFNNPVFVNDDFIILLQDFICKHANQSNDLTSINKLLKNEDNTFSLEFKDVIDAYNLLKFKYHGKEFINDDLICLNIDLKNKIKFLAKFTKEEIKEINKLSWLFYNHCLELVREQTYDKVYTIGPYDYVNSSFVKYLS